MTWRTFEEARWKGLARCTDRASYTGVRIRKLLLITDQPERGQGFGETQTILVAFICTVFIVD